ncbi:hypothetical protein TRFO_06521 [Tritrichomonas foetus]|uniref:Peptidase C19 ubiquitin carboxyl-terminal hydrolase domain-containing protein n=1 Tax=Tritrichomonas foetus TaxID=1144522 RepID=A0A1J4JX37_9EUKA|nr:hypothetical protein TRFO_06521 [Tritrichomonas foetus]|eukprot:OHT03711.1 hypothetical protein TRFO_06521 [Tritrichomonas foetus]
MHRERRNPKHLLIEIELLKPQLNISKDLYQFRGITNYGGYSCYVISFLQIILHCNLLPMLEEEENKILYNLKDLMNSKQNKKAVSLETFFIAWKGWEYDKELPTSQGDVIEFANFFLLSLSQSLQNLFLIPFMNPNENVSKFIFNIELDGSDIQQCVNNSLSSNIIDGTMPSYFLIHVNRINSNNTYNRQIVNLNTQLQINGENYYLFSVITHIGNITKLS